MSVLTELFFTFAKIGLFTFGGGYAMISLIEHECVEQKQWMTADEMMNMTVIAESTPGPIAINCATFAGYKRAGFFGAIVATIGMVVPSFAIIFLISMFLDDFLEVAIVANAFRGIKVGVGILIFRAGWNMTRKMQKKNLPRLILAGSCIVMFCINLFAWKFSTISLMLLAAAISLCFFVLQGAPEQRGGAEK